MCKKKIPSLYVLVYNKLKDKSIKNKIGKHEAKFTAGYLRVPRQNLQQLFCEMKRYGLIDFVDPRTIELLDFDSD